MQRWVSISIYIYLNYTHILKNHLLFDYLLNYVCRSLLKVGFKRSLSERTISLTKATHYYSTNCSITQMKALSALSQLLVLAEDTLIVLDLESLTLVRSLKFKQATCFSINENPLIDDPFTVELCVGSRKKIIYIHLTAEQARITKEISTSLTPCTLVMDGAHICFAMGKEYCLLDILSGEIQPLFSIDTPEQIPLINRVTKVITLFYFYDLIII